MESMLGIDSKALCTLGRCFVAEINPPTKHNLWKEPVALIANSSSTFTPFSFCLFGFGVLFRYETVLLCSPGCPQTCGSPFISRPKFPISL